MRRMHVFALAAGALFAAPAVVAAQAGEESRAVAGGGITVPGWTGKIDPKEVQAGLKLADAKLAPMGAGMHVTTGPSVTYWNPANTATGDYTVKATFNEPKYMSINNHPHPYGIMIGGNDLSGDNATFMYCTAYGNGTFIVRGFGPAPFNISAQRPTAHASINKAAGTNQPVTQEIAVSVKGDNVECAINGQVVATYPKSAIVGAGKLKSTDGLYGIRFGHNTEVMVTGLQLIKP